MYLQPFDCPQWFPVDARLPWDNRPCLVWIKHATAEHAADRLAYAQRVNGAWQFMSGRDGKLRPIDYVTEEDYTVLSWMEIINEQTVS